MESSTPQAQQGQVFRFDQSGALLRKVMENAAVGMVLVGIDRRLLYANNAFAEMLGYARRRGAGTRRRRHRLDGDRDGFLLYLDRLIAARSTSTAARASSRAKDGSPIWVLASASVLRSDRTGRPLYVILQTTNIDRQKRAEAALLYTESRWNSALEAAKQGVWEHDARRTGEMYYSPMWRKMRGFSPYEHVDGDQEAWLSRLHPDDRERIRAIVGKQEHGDDGYDTLEYRERHKDGHYIWILSRGRPVEWDKDGNAVRTIGTDTDITRLKEVEQALAEEKERLRVTLESIGDGVISTDAERRISFMNPIAEEMTGWTSAEAVGKNRRRGLPDGRSRDRRAIDRSGRREPQQRPALLSRRRGRAGRPQRASAAISAPPPRRCGRPRARRSAPCSSSRTSRRAGRCRSSWRIRRATMR